MNAQTLEALKASIAKWERNAEATEATSYRTSPSNCPLCDLFFREECQGCPISERTGRSKCDGTPYDDAHRAKVRWFWGVRSDAEQYAHAAARDEVAFLKSLLPAQTEALCSDCPPIGYPTDITRCSPCPRRADGGSAP